MGDQTERNAIASGSDGHGRASESWASLDEAATVDAQPKIRGVELHRAPGVIDEDDFCKQATQIGHPVSTSISGTHEGEKIRGAAPRRFDEFAADHSSLIVEGSGEPSSCDIVGILPGSDISMCYEPSFLVNISTSFSGAEPSLGDQTEKGLDVQIPSSLSKQTELNSNFLTPLGVVRARAEGSFSQTAKEQFKAAKSHDSVMQDNSTCTYHQVVATSL